MLHTPSLLTVGNLELLADIASISIWMEMWLNPMLEEMRFITLWQELSHCMGFTSWELSRMLGIEWRGIIISLKMGYKLRMFCSTIWQSVQWNRGLCFKLIFLLLLSGSPIPVTTLDTTMQLEVISMDFGMRSNPDLMDHQLQEMYVRWEVPWDRVITMLLTPTFDLDWESSNLPLELILAEVYLSEMMRILGRTIEELLALFLISHSTKTVSVVFWQNRQDTWSSTT